MRISDWSSDVCSSDLSIVSKPSISRDSKYPSSAGHGNGLRTPILNGNPSVFSARITMRALLVDQHALAFQPPAIAGQRAITADHAMARHQQCDMVGRTRARHCTHGLRLADRRRNFGIRAHFAVRNRLQIFPDFKLERGAARKTEERRVGKEYDSPWTSRW